MEQLRRAKRFALVNELDEVALLGVGEFVGGVAGHGQGKRFSIG
jgi:hypothetical protein